MFPKSPENIIGIFRNIVGNMNFFIKILITIWVIDSKDYHEVTPEKFKQFILERKGNIICEFVQANKLEIIVGKMCSILSSLVSITTLVVIRDSNHSLTIMQLLPLRA